jgi:hypothetical protein
MAVFCCRLAEDLQSNIPTVEKVVEKATNDMKAAADAESNATQQVQ